MFAVGAALKTLISLEVAGLPDFPCAPFGIVAFSFEVSYYGRR